MAKKTSMKRVKKLARKAARSELKLLLEKPPVGAA
jgi:hypothetical protein